MKNILSKAAIAALSLTIALSLCNFPASAAESPVTTSSVYKIYSDNTTENNIITFADFCVEYFSFENVEPAENTFSDLDNSSANVLRLVALKYISGCGNGCIGTYMTEDRAYIILSRILKDYIDVSKAEAAVLAPNVEENMCYPDYWISKSENPYSVLMTSKEIERLNSSILNVKETNMADLSALPESFDGKALAKELSSFASPENHYIDGKAVPEIYYEQMRQNISNADVSPNMSMSYGFTTNYTVMKAYPYAEFLSDDPNDSEWDDFVNSGIRCNEPIVIYFFTADKKFAYVRSSICSGWVSSDDIAVCQSKSQWQSAQQTDDFLVVTGDKIYLEPSSADPELSEKVLTMGTVLKLKTPENSDMRIINRTPWNNYVVAIAGRNDDGSYIEKTALIPMNRDVHKGYLEFTQAGIIKQAFKCLGNRYGWGGMLKSPDCSGYALDVYKCFGLDIPRNTTWQALMPVQVDDIGDLSAEEKTNALKNTPMGAIIQFNGHEMIYLGESGGRLYTINDVSSLKNPENVQAGVLRIRSVIVNDLTAIRPNGHTWFEDMNKVIVPWKIAK